MDLAWYWILLIGIVIGFVARRPRRIRRLEVESFGTEDLYLTDNGKLGRVEVIGKVLVIPIASQDVLVH